MNPQAAQHTHTSSWVTFTYATFIGSVLMVGAGVALMPLDIWIKGYFAMGIVMIIQSCITMTKTIRDVHERHRGRQGRAPADGHRTGSGGPATVA
jgi:hypothetical protein